MSHKMLRGRALARLVAFCLGTSALTVPALAATYSVGGGAITTTNADNSNDATGSGGGFGLFPNTTGNNDAVAVSGVTIHSSSGIALDFSGQGSNSYSVTMQGSTLTSANAAGVWLQNAGGGLLSFDSTGGTANSISGSQGIVLANGTNNGSVSIKTGADTITTTGTTAEVLYGVGQGTGTVSIDSVGATLTGGGTYGIAALTGSGAITIGGLNGGIASTINVANGFGIFTSSLGNQSITLASSGVINALNGISVQGQTITIDSFGTISGTNTAINGSLAGPALTVTLESGSVTMGPVLGGTGSTINKFNIVAGADISNATFNGNGGSTTLDLQGTGTASVDLSKLSNIQTLQKDQAGTWTISNAGNFSSVIVNAGMLNVGSTTVLTSSTSLTVNGGTFSLNGNDVSVGTLSGTGGNIALGANNLSVTTANLDTVVSSVISGTGMLTKSGAATLTLSGNNTYSGGTVLISRSLVLGSSTAAGTGPITLTGTALSDLDYANGVNIANTIVLSGSFPRLTVFTGTAAQSGTISESGGPHSLLMFGSGTLILSGNNTYTGGTIISSGNLQVSSDQNLGDPAGAITFTGGYSTLTFGAAFNPSATRAINVNTSPGLSAAINTNGFDITLAQGISGTGALVKTGNGTLTLNGVGSFSGPLGVNQGILRLGVDNALSPSSVNVNGGGVATFDLNSHNLTIGQLNGLGNITLGSGILTVTGAASWDGVISGTGSVVMENTFTVSNSNTYTGGTTVAGTGNLTIGVNNTGSIVGNITDNGIVTFNRDDTTTFPGVISGAGGVVQANSGTTILTGVNSYTGGTTVNSGVLRIGVGGSLASTGALAVNHGTFDLNSQTQTVGALSGTGGTITLGSGSLTTNSSANANLASVISGSGSLTKAGSGALILTGANTYTGGTTVGGGVLQVTGSGTLGSTSGSVTVSSGTLDLGGTTQTQNGGVTLGSGSTVQNGTLSSSGTFALNGANVSAVLAGTGGVLVTGGNGTSLYSVSTYTGPTVIQVADSTLGLQGTASIANSSGVNVAQAEAIFSIAQVSGGGTSITSLSGNGVVNLGSNTLTLTNASGTYSGLIQGAGGVTGQPAPGTLVLAGGIETFSTGAQLAFGTMIVEAGTLRLTTGVNFGNANSVLTVEGGTLDLGTTTLTQLGSVTLTGGTIQNGTLSSSIFNLQSGTVSAVLTGSGAVSKTTSGTVTLSGANTYTGGTTITAGTLSISSDADLGTGGTVMMGAGTALAFTATGNYGHAVLLAGDPTFDIATGQTVTYGGVIADGASAGTLVKTDSGTLVLTGANTYTGGTVVNGGVLRLGSGGSIASNGNLTITGGTFDLNGQTQTVGALSGTGGIITLGSGALTTNSSNNTTLAAVISGAGSLTKAGSGTLTLIGANTYQGQTTVLAGTVLLGPSGSLASSSSAFVASGATLDLEGHNQTLSTLAGSGNVTLGSGVLTFSAQGNFAGAISGSGSIVTTSPTILSGVNTFTGTTTINTNLSLSGQGSFSFSSVVDNGNLDISGTNSGTATKSLSGSGSVTLGSRTLTLTNAADTFSGTISGTGGLQIGGGTETLTNSNFYTGTTTISAGTLRISNGSIASSIVSVANGATLTGTGKVGATGVASGGTLTPGFSTAPGTLTIAGNLTLASGSSFADTITASAAGLASVSGAASINGNAIASFVSGAYTIGQQYTLITATGGVSGTFSSLVTTGLPGYLRASLSYDPNDVYLKLGPNTLAPSLASNVTTNQHNVVAAIDAAVTGGVVPGSGFYSLYGLSGASLNSAIDQISGRIGPNVSNAVGQSFLSFLAVTAEGGMGGADNYAPGGAYDAAAAPHRAQLGAGQTRVWGGAYGGHVGLSADVTSGAASLSASNVGLIGGADMQLGDNILAGVTVDWGRQHFNSGNGSGVSTDYAFGLYGRADMDAAYVTAAFGYGWHQIATLRVITIAGTDVLQGKQNADDFGGRIEAGWRMALDDIYTLAPYGAFAGERFESPAYAETAIAGASTFALSYAAHTSTLGRSELGAHLDRSYDLGDGGLTADIEAAWAHQLDDQPFTQANFENLATASFQVLGVRPTRDMALLGADIELQYRSGLFLGLKGEGLFGAGTTMVEGLGTFGLRW
jgi:fibronectin-binding autotransporter adhesin